MWGGEEGRIEVREAEVLGQAGELERDQRTTSCTGQYLELTEDGA